MVSEWCHKRTIFSLFIGRYLWIFGAFFSETIDDIAHCYSLGFWAVKHSQIQWIFILFLVLRVVLIPLNLSGLYPEWCFRDGWFLVGSPQRAPKKTSLRNHFQVLWELIRPFRLLHYNTFTFWGLNLSVRQISTCQLEVCEIFFPCSLMFYRPKYRGKHKLQYQFHAFTHHQIRPIKMKKSFRQSLWKTVSWIKRFFHW